MDLFAGSIAAIRDFLARKADEGKVSEHIHRGPVRWPTEKNRNLVLTADTAVELGHPKDASTAFLFWVDDPSAVVDRRITLVGPDLRELAGRQVSFGKAVIVHGSGFDEQNSYARYREMELLRYDIHLDGCMMRGVSQYQREWSRVSRQALDRGFSLNTLGGALMDRFSRLDYVRAVETIFITSGKEDVLELQGIAGGIFDRIGAMNKMADDLNFDCDTCEFTEVCGEVSQLRAMHRTMRERGSAAHAR